MQLTSNNKISERLLHPFYKERTNDLLKRLIKGNYAKKFNLLKNWALLRTFSIISYKLTFDYIHLHQEKFDEN